MISNPPALPLSGRQAVVRGAVPDWWSGQVARYRLVAAQWQPSGSGLFAHMTASSLSRVSTYTLSLFLVLRANSFRRGGFGDHGQTL